MRSRTTAGARAAAILWGLSLAAGLSTGCASDLESLPPEPGSPPPPTAAGTGPAAPVPEPPRGAGLLDAALHGERLLEGVLLLDPALDPVTAEAVFRIRNEGDRDLVDLILAVVFAVPSGEEGAPLRPRIVTVECPLAPGGERDFRVPPPPGLPSLPVRFRVVAGPPELLASSQGASQGTTFLGGLLECVSLATDLTGTSPSVTVGLRDRGAAASDLVLPPLEGQLLLARSGRLVWSGPWILLPRGDPAAGGVRTIRWNLPREVSLAGCSPFLRVREKR